MGAENLIPVALVAGLLEFSWKQKQGSFPGDFSECFQVHISHAHHHFFLGSCCDYYFVSFLVLLLLCDLIPNIIIIMTNRRYRIPRRIRTLCKD